MLVDNVRVTLAVHLGTERVLQVVARLLVGPGYDRRPVGDLYEVIVFPLRQVRRSRPRGFLSRHLVSVGAELDLTRRSEMPSVRGDTRFEAVEQVRPA